MANTTTGSITAANLQEWLYRKTLDVFEPNLYFYKMGLKPMVPNGYHTLRWSKFVRLTAANISTLTEPLTPTPLAFDATTVSVTPTQYGATVTVSDRMMYETPIQFLSGAAGALGDAMARKIDAVIQTTVMAGTTIIYVAGRANRAAITSTDYFTRALLNQARAQLDANAAPTFDGNYVAIMHPNVAYDLRAETGTGGWLDQNKYTTSDKLFKGEIGMLDGIRVVVSPFVQTFASTTTVFPTLVLGYGAYGVGEFSSLQTYLTPATPTDSDPLVQRRTVGAKVNFGTVILQQNGMVRIESASSQSFSFSESST